jgi:hypothetical protein
VVVVGVFRRFLEFVGSLIEQLPGPFGMAAQLFMVISLRFVDLMCRLENVVLSLGQVGMLGRVNVGFRALCESYADESQTNGKHSAKIKAFLLHNAFSLCLNMPESNPVTSLAKGRARNLRIKIGLPPDIGKRQFDGV